MKKFFQSFNFPELPIQMMRTFFIAKETIPFIRKHRLWTGFLQYKWILFVMLIISITFSFSIIGDIQHFLGLNSDQEIPEILNASLAPNMEDLTDAVESERRLTSSNGSKYLLLIFMEIIIFYFSAKTVNAVSSRDTLPTFNEFVNAEKRMIKIMVLNFVKALIAHAVIYVGLSILGKSGWTSIIMFFVYAYFIGYAFLDNYNELYVRTIKNSDRIIKHHAGAAITLGILVSILLHIPILGPLFAPILASIAGAIYGNRYKIQELFLPEELHEGEEEQEYI